MEVKPHDAPRAAPGCGGMMVRSGEGDHTFPTQGAEASLCPVCGGPNACAPAQSGSLETACWCTDVVITPAALARVPEAERNKACLCPRCATDVGPSDA